VIVERSAEILGVEVDTAGAVEIAGRSRGTPRIANRLLRRVRDYAQVRGSGKVDKPTAQAALEMLEVTSMALDEMDRKLLLSIIERHQGGRWVLETLAAALAEDTGCNRRIYEPVPNADRLPEPHAAWTSSHPTGIRPSWNQAQRRQQSQFILSFSETPGERVWQVAELPEEPLLFGGPIF